MCGSAAMEYEAVPGRRPRRPLRSYLAVRFLEFVEWR
jgi:hypothetical protein